MDAFTSYIFGTASSALDIIRDLNGDEWISALSVERAMCVKNPNSSYAHRVNKIVNMIKQHPDFVVESDGVTVVIKSHSYEGFVVASNGTCRILGVRKSNNISGRVSYYYNTAALCWAVCGSKSSVGDRLNRLTSSEILPMLEEHGEYMFLDQHCFLPILRTRLEDAVNTGVYDDSVYHKALDGVFFIRFGIPMSEVCRSLGVDDANEIRGKLGNDDKYHLACIQNSISAGLFFGEELDKLLTSERLVKLYRRNLI